MSEEFEDFDEYWAHYLTQHDETLTRLAHAAGTAGGAALIVAGLLRGRVSRVALGLALGTVPAYLSHVLVEENSADCLKHPVWKQRADLRLARLVVQDELPEEFYRLLGDERTRRELLPEGE